MAGTIKENNKWIQDAFALPKKLHSSHQSRMGDDVFDDSTEGEHSTGEKDLRRMSEDLFKVPAPCTCNV